MYPQQVSNLLYTTRCFNPDDHNSNLELLFANSVTCGTIRNHTAVSETIMDSYIVKHVFQFGKLKFFSCVHEKRTDVRGAELILFLKTTLNTDAALQTNRRSTPRIRMSLFVIC
jgi:hypothetical protein